MSNSPFLWIILIIGFVGGGIQATINFNKLGGDIWRFGSAGMESINDGNMEAPTYNPDTGAVESQ